jgi:acyl carrier protein
MNKIERITQIIFHAIDQVNLQLSDGEKIEKSLNTELLGQSSTLDSLGLVNLIVAVEEGVQDGFGETITLANEHAMSSENSPFKNVQSLVAYIDSSVKG